MPALALSHTDCFLPPRLKGQLGQELLCKLLGAALAEASDSLKVSARPETLSNASLNFSSAASTASPILSVAGWIAPSAAFPAPMILTRAACALSLTRLT